MLLESQLYAYQRRSWQKILSHWKPQGCDYTVRRSMASVAKRNQHRQCVLRFYKGHQCAWDLFGHDLVSGGRSLSPVSQEHGIKRAVLHKQQEQYCLVSGTWGPQHCFSFCVIKPQSLFLLIHRTCGHNTHKEEPTTVYMVIILKGHIVATSRAGSSNDRKAESIKPERMCVCGGGFLMRGKLHASGFSSLWISGNYASDH